MRPYNQSTKNYWQIKGQTMIPWRTQLSVVAVLTILAHGALPSQTQETPPAGRESRVTLLLVGHGGPATDFPTLTEYFRLHGRNSDEARAIENEMMHWPRNERNDSYWAGFMKIVRELERSGGFHSVRYAFNEMCAPTVEEALEVSKGDRPDTIVVTSIMMTSGGVHSEKDIPLSIQNFRDQNPEIPVIYAWPYAEADIVKFLNGHIGRFTSTN